MRFSAASPAARDLGLSLGVDQFQRRHRFKFELCEFASMDGLDISIGVALERLFECLMRRLLRHSDRVRNGRKRVIPQPLYAPWQGRKIPESYKFAVGAVQQERVGRTFSEFVDSGAFAMGTPETIIKVLKKYQEAGVNQVLCFMQMGNLAHGRIMDSINLFGRQVISVFQIGARRAPG